MGAQDVAKAGAWAAHAVKRQRLSPSSSGSDSSICLEENGQPLPLYHDFAHNTPSTSGGLPSTVSAEPSARDPSSMAIGVGVILSNIGIQHPSPVRPLKRYLDEEESGYRQLPLPRGGSCNGVDPESLCPDAGNQINKDPQDQPSPLPQHLDTTSMASCQSTKEDPEEEDLGCASHSPDFYMISVGSEGDDDTSDPMEEPTKAMKHWKMHWKTGRQYIHGICDDPENSCNLSPRHRGRQHRQCRTIRARKPSTRPA
ncbi:hypothetical protein CC79DRAFT_200938 [Sarocladium strictum]